MLCENLHEIISSNDKSLIETLKFLH